MSHKGKKFTEADLPKRHKLTAEQVKEHCEKQTERYRVVAYDRSEREDRQAIIAEELDERAMRKLPENIRVHATNLLRLTPDERLQVFAAFRKDGTINYPFEMVEA